MGLIKAAFGSAGGVLADQWKEYFYCESMEADVLMTKGRKRMSKRSSNTKGFDNIITQGSVAAVADGQCMLIVDQGRVVEICAEPGEFVYDASAEPTIFQGKLSDSIAEVLKNMGRRFTFGGEAPRDQRIYYVNTKELIGNKYGTPSPVPFRVVDTNIGLDIDISVKCFGEYSYRITNPVLFYTNVCGNSEEDYLRQNIDGQLKSEFLTALQPAFAKISGMGIRYSALPGHTEELAEALNEALSQKWKEFRGIEIVSIGVSSVKAPEEDEKMIKELQRNGALRNPGMAAAHLAGAQAQAMQDAAKNEGGMGAMGGFFGMGMSRQAGGADIGNLFEMDRTRKQAEQKSGDTQTVGNDSGTGLTESGMNSAGIKNSESKRAGVWRCSCGEENTGKFCVECGAAKPVNKEWKCVCGAVNTGKFCPECGAKRPEGKAYRCSKCGWEPEDPFNPPKFCPECGDPFDENDVK